MGMVFFEGIDGFRKKIEDFMDNDFDTSGALGVLFEFVKEVNSFRLKNSLSEKSIDEILSFLKSLEAFFGFIFPKETVLDEEIMAKIEERNEARKNKDFEKSDKIRDELLAKGIVLEDTPEGTFWKKAMKLSKKPLSFILKWYNLCVALIF
jgi:cysteinyl-tRNA synthetase